MNPRHRRLLIPGLLIALLVIVVVSALADRADAEVRRLEPVSRLDDPRITESSGLVVSRNDDDLAYTINDSGNASVVLAVEISTGRVVGSAESSTPFVDAEALSIDREGTLWVADTGDNNRQRSDVALYSLAEPGRRDAGRVAVSRFPLAYPDGPRDVEALVVDPRDDKKYLLTKGLLGGEVLALPDRLEPDRPNRVTALDGTVPGVVTDAAFTPDGSAVVARTYTGGYVLDPRTWKTVGRIALPRVEQGETVATEPSGTTFLVGSEGSGSPLFRIELPRSEPTPSPSAATTGDDTTSPQEAADQGPPPGGNGFAGATWAWAGLVVVLLAAISVAATRRR